MARRRETRNRRPKGLGSVFDSPPGSGRWFARPPRRAGMPEPAKVPVESRAAGEQLLIKWRRDREDKIKGAQGRTTGQWLAQWLDDVVAAEIKDGSLVRYRNLVEKHIVPYLGDIPLDDLEPPHVRSWLSKLRRTALKRGKGKSTPPKPLANDTIRAAFVRLKSAMDVAVNDRLIRFNPCAGVKPPEMNSRDAYALTDQEARRLLKAFDGHWLYALFFVALATGMREGELLGLRWANVVLAGDEPRIQVREQIQSINGQRSFTSVKSKASRRNIAINADLVTILLEQRARVHARRDDPEAVWPEADMDLVFPSEVGTPLFPKNLLRTFRLGLRRAGLPEEIRFHDLRHTAGSLMLADGAQITDVSKILGHSSVAVTAKIYAHSYPENQRKAVGGVTRQLKADAEQGEAQPPERNDNDETSS